MSHSQISGRSRTYRTFCLIVRLLLKWTPEPVPQYSNLYFTERCAVRKAFSSTVMIIAKVFRYIGKVMILLRSTKY